MKNKLIITDFAWKQQIDGKTNIRNVRLTGLFQEQKLIEVHCERLERPSILGNIYIGRVKNIQKNINAAFIEIAPGQMGYYPLEQCKDPIYVKKINSPNMVQGDEVLVQIAKENLKTKLPVLTTNINLTGTYCVLTSENKTVGVSTKIKGEKRNELVELSKQMETKDFGVIIRTNAQNANPEAVMAEYQRMKQEFDTLVSTAKYRTCFSCLKRNQPDYLKTVQNSYFDQLEEIITDIPEVYEEVQELCSRNEQMRTIPVRLYQDKLLPLSALYNIEKQMERALGKTVWLPSGGYLVIEPTEALTVIDVNTGKSVKKKNPQEHFLNINKEAAKEVAHQLRLRNISGIIIVDFIDLKKKEDKQELLSYLTQHVKADPIPVQVVDMTKLDLVEMTRKKVSKSLKEQLT